MINVIASISLKPGTVEAFLKEFNANLADVRAEEGCIEYFPAVDADVELEGQDTDALLVTVIEKWSSADALRAHLVAPHMLAFRERVKDFVESVSLRVLSDASQ